MRKRILFMLSLGSVFLLNACAGKQDKTTSETTEPSAGVKNPWSYFETLAKAEEAAGFSFDLPEMIDDSCKATSFGVMDGDKILLEVVYEEDNREITVRKALGEGQDISGVYGFEETASVEEDGIVQHIFTPADGEDPSEGILMNMDYAGCSWSFFAPDGLEDDDFDDFTEALFQHAEGSASIRMEAFRSIS